MEGPNNHLNSNEKREAKSNKLWQSFADQHHEPETAPVFDDTAALAQYEGAPQANFEEFWAKYDEVLESARQKQSQNSMDQALTLMDGVFLTNEQQFKSVTIPVGKYTYHDEYGYNHFIIIESKYLASKHKKLAFKDINHVEETKKGLLIQDIRKQSSKQHTILIPHKTEEYVDLKRFLKQVEAVNLQQANVYPNITSLRKGYWHDQPLISFGKPKRILIQKKSVQGLGNIPTDWATLFGGIGTLSIASFSVLGLPFVGFLGIVGAAHAIDTYKHKKRFSFNALHVAEQYIQYVFNYNHKTHIIKIPLDEIYGVKNTFRGLKILDMNKRSFWKTDAPPHKKFQPIIPKNMHGIDTLKIFLEEVAEHNLSQLL